MEPGYNYSQVDGLHNHNDYYYTDQVIYLIRILIRQS